MHYQSLNKILIEDPNETNQFLKSFDSANRAGGHAHDKKIKNFTQLYRNIFFGQENAYSKSQKYIKLNQFMKNNVFVDSI